MRTFLAITSNCRRFQHEKRLEGIGSFVNQLRGVNNNDGTKNRIVLDNTGSIVRRRPIRSNIGS